MLDPFEYELLKFLIYVDAQFGHLLFAARCHRNPVDVLFADALFQSDEASRVEFVEYIQLIETPEQRIVRVLLSLSIGKPIQKIVETFLDQFFVGMVVFPELFVATNDSERYDKPPVLFYFM